MLAEINVDALPTRQDKIARELVEAGLSDAFPGVKLADFRIEDAHHGFSTILRVHLTPAADNAAKNWRLKVNHHMPRHGHNIGDSSMNRC